ncbi:hypothetical protein ACIBSV_43975 [Embleya sp. NPDC050154]|uniref:hypothetical protein n=1 Tax=Embleya sp. NPDC050154 TaxID=3363988 RepID=UPI003798BB3E
MHCGGQAVLFLVDNTPTPTAKMEDDLDRIAPEPASIPCPPDAATTDGSPDRERECPASRRD